MLKREIVSRVAVVALSVGAAYIYWLAYRDANRNRLTRLVDACVDKTTMPGVSRRTTMLVVVGVTFVLAVAMAADLVASLWQVAAE